MRDTAVVTTTMPLVHPSRWIGRGLRGRTTTPSDRPSKRTHGDAAAIRPMTAGQSFASGVKGDTGQRHVADHLPPSDRLRHAPTDCRRAAKPGARRLATRWRHPPGWRAAWRSHRRDRRRRKPKGDRRDAGLKSRSAVPRRGAPGCCSTAGLSPSGGSGAAIIARLRGRAGHAGRSRCRGRTSGDRGRALVAALAAQARLLRTHADEEKGIAAPRPAQRAGARSIFRASTAAAARRNRPPRSGRGSLRSCRDVRRCNDRSGDNRPRRRHRTAPRPRR